jgi:ribosomal protein S27AE
VRSADAGPADPADPADPSDPAEDDNDLEASDDLCPECGAELDDDGVCPNCGYTAAKKSDGRCAAG